MQVIPAAPATPGRPVAPEDAESSDFMAMLAALLATPPERAPEAAPELPVEDPPLEEAPPEDLADGDRDVNEADAALPEQLPPETHLPPQSHVQTTAAPGGPPAGADAEPSDAVEPTGPARLQQGESGAENPTPDTTPAESPEPPAEPVATDRRPARPQSERAETAPRGTREAAPAQVGVQPDAPKDIETFRLHPDTNRPLQVAPQVELPVPREPDADVESPQPRTALQTTAETQLRENPAQPLPQPMDQRVRERAPLDAATRTLAARQIETIRQAVRGFALNQAGEYELRVALSPPNLGALKLRIKVEEGHVSGVIITENHAARHLLQQHLPEIREALAQQGMQLGDFQFQGEARQDAPKQQHDRAVRTQAAGEPARPDFEAARVRDGRVMGYL